MGTPQISYSQNPAAGRPGQLATCNAWDSRTIAVAEASGIEPGRIVVRSASQTSGAGSVTKAVLPAGQAADVDAVIATGASAAAPQTYETATLDGVVGASAILVPAAVTMTISSHADWDATTAVLTAVNSEGVTVTENLSIPDAGNTTLTTTGLYVRVVSLAIPAQSGAGGTFTLGYAQSSTITGAQIIGVAALDPSQEPPVLLPQYKIGAAWTEGVVWVATDALVVEGAKAYVRVFAGVGESLGILRGDADGGDAVLVPGARFGKVASATLAQLVLETF